MHAEGTNIQWRHEGRLSTKTGFTHVLHVVYPHKEPEEVFTKGERCIPSSKFLLHKETCEIEVTQFNIDIFLNNYIVNYTFVSEESVPNYSSI